MAAALLDPLQIQGAGAPLHQCTSCDAGLQRSASALARPLVRQDDHAHEYSIPDRHAVTSEEKHEIAARLLRQVTDAKDTYENRDGACRVKRLSGLVGTHCWAFGECPGCPVSRLSNPEPRQRFRRMLVERELRLTPSSGRRVVRGVSIGCGGLLTDFECLLDLWTNGFVIESFVAIDTSYTGDNEYTHSLNALARCFAPCRVFSFRSADDYVKAVRRRPEVYGEATLFIHCDAGAVPNEQYKEAAAAALLPGRCAYELWNIGWGHRGHDAGRPPVEDFLPAHLRLDDEFVTRGAYSLGVLRRVPRLTAAISSDEAASQLEEVSEPSLNSGLRGKRIMEEAQAWLAQTARQRAAQSGSRLFRVVYDAKPRMAVRRGPSRSAAIAGARPTGSEVIATEVNDDGWVRLSPELDAYAGYERYEPGTELWMLIHADDVGELMREVVLDGEGEEIDDDAWLPELV